MMAPIRRGGITVPYQPQGKAKYIAWEGEREADVLYTVTESAPFDGRKRTR
jgi:hypothetical protein